MKKPTILKFVLFALILIQSINSYSQIRKDFTPRKEISLNGDILVIGNNILNRYVQGDRWTPDILPTTPYDGTDVNDTSDMRYINVDNSDSNFNSSQAKLTIPVASQACYEIVYAALYWSGTYTTAGADRSKINEIKLKTPTSNGYLKLTGTVIHDEGTVGAGAYASFPYACYKDITDEVKQAKQGDYTVANLITSQGKFSPGGNSAGWSIFVIYKDVKLPNKFITSFDGFAYIKSKDPALVIPINGFKTNPNGPVNAKIAFSALEGDYDLAGDGFQIIGKKPLSVTEDLKTVTRKINVDWTGTKTPNFFDSSITDGDAYFMDRVPNSKNTLGYDAGVLKIANAGNNTLQHSETAADLTISTSADAYFLFFTALSVDIIAPKIVLTKLVKGVDLNGNEYDASNANIYPDKELRYEIWFQNEGNDDAKDFTITDVLPNNIVFNGAGDIFPLDNGITVQSYDPATRTVVFKISNLLVKAKGGKYSIKFKVKTVKDCNALTEACSNEIKNTAISKYWGTENTFGPFGEGSYSSISTCNVGEPSATNFLIGLDKCTFEQTVFLCGDVKLKAAGGYKSYIWSGPDGVFGGNNQEVTVTKPGTYTVICGGVAPCKDIKQTFYVKEYLGNTKENPVNPYADNIDPDSTANPKLPYKCLNDGKPFPKIFLCGKTSTKFIDTKITGASSIVWQETKDVPPSDFSDTCPYESATNWTEVGRGPTFTANRSGTFRVVVTFNNTCVNYYYFNVYQSLVNPTFTQQDVVCNTLGSITITNPKPQDGYEYSKDGTNYQPSNTFDNLAAGSYTIHIKQTSLNGFLSACDYPVDVTILKKTFSSTVETTNPACTGKTGSIKVTANGVPGAYKFIVRNVATGNEVGNSGLIDFPNYHLFEDITPGKYEVETSTKDGCLEVKTVEIFDYSLTANATLTKALTCKDGEITVKVTGGTPRPGPPPYYFYYVNSTTTYVTDPVIPITVAGDYNIVVVDDLGCRVVIPTIKVPAIVKPTATINKKDITCYGNNDGEISISVSPANSGYTVSYSINGTAGPFGTISPIKNLAAGDYDVVVKYTYDNVDCFDASQIVKISAPASALTASAGVAELSGCGPLGNENQGLVRITNAQGGVPPYLYSFDGGTTWITSNQAYINPSVTPYTFYIKDSSPAPACIFPMTGIVLDPKPSDPTITVSAPTFNCNGNATTTVTITNTGGNNYTYEYLLNGVVNTNNPSNVFVNVPPSAPGVPHIITVQYKLVSVPTFSTLLKEDFGSGGTTKSPGIASAYCFNDQRVNAPYTCSLRGTPTRSVEDNQYSVTSFFWRGDTAWFPFKDHTTATNPTPDPLGRYLLVNIGDAAGDYGILYSKPIIDVIKNQPVKVDLFVGNLLNTGVNGAAPIVRFELVDQTGKVVAREDTGKIADAPTDPNRTKWIPIHLELNPGDNDKLTFVIRSGSLEYGGNDLVIDDISVYQLPKSCLSTKEFKVVVDPNKKFTASVEKITATKCKGSKDGTFTIVATNFDTINGYQYSIDNGVNWINATTAEVLVTGLGEGPYDVLVRYDATSVGCSFTFGPTIGSPAKFEVNASATVAKCSVGATVTASAIGGTPGYTFTLTDTAVPFTVVTFPSNGILTNIKPGTYTVSGVDANGCPDKKDTDLVIDSPVAPIAKIAQDTGLCFDNDKAKITVNISNGVGPYTYQVKFNSGPYSSSSPVTGSSFTYDVTATGDYEFLITDAFGCAAVAVSQKINPKLTAKALTTTSLTCNTPPDAKIEVTISGGTSPFTYTVKDSGGVIKYTSPAPITGPKFTYSTTIAGTYTFDITDKNSCTTKVDGVIDAITKPEVTATPTNPKCNGDSNGSVTLAGSLGSGGYLYSFNSSPFTNKATYIGLKANVSYPYQVTDSNGCISDIKYITLTEPDKVSGEAKISVPYTCDGPAEITVFNVLGGSLSYNYVLNRNGVAVGSSQTTTTFKNISLPGNYTVTITDSNGCFFITTPALSIVALNPPTAMVIKNTALKCPSNLVDVTITSVTGGTGTLSYAITAPAGLTRPYQVGDNVFKNLAPGTYTFAVKDANNCIYSLPYTIDKLIPIVVSGVVVNNISCLGATDGAAKFTISDLGNGVNYSYTIDGGTAVTGTTPATGSTTFVVNVPSLGVGDHTLTITDLGTNCAISKTVKILAPSAVLAIKPTTVTAMTCNVNGKAVVNTTGGWGSNQYTLTQPDGTIVGPQPENSFNNLTQAGDYTVKVKDLNGCEVFDTFKLADKVKPKATINLLSDICYDPANKATIIVTPGVVPSPTYVYSINNGTYQTSGTFSNLEPGDYVVTVLDNATGCTIDLASQHIAKQLTATVGKFKGVDCTSAPDVVIKGEVFDGVAPYTYTVTINGGTSSGVNTITGNLFTYTDPTATTATGNTTYVFTIKDKAGCTTISTVVVEPKTNPNFTATPNSTILCNGQATGSITVNIDTTFGVGPYVIDVYNTTTSTPYGEQTTGLPAGNYTVKVTDSKSCSTPRLNVIIKEPTPIDVKFKVDPITCGVNGVSLGAITIQTVSGGTKNYTYNVKGINYDVQFTNQDGTSQVFKVVNFGYYEIIVTDANGCSKIIKDILVASPPDDLDITVTAPPADCSTGGTANVAIGASTGIIGNGPFYFAIYDGSVPSYPNPVGTFAWLPEDSNGSKQATFYNLTPGVKYTFIVYDSDAAHGGTGTGCYYFETAEDAIPTKSTLTIDKLQANNITCFNANDGNVSFKVYSQYAVTTDVDYQIFNQLTLAPMGPVQSGIVPAATTPATPLIINNFGALPFGNYFVLVTEILDRTPTPDKKGCSVASIPFNITGSTTALELTAESKKNDNCALNAGKVDAFPKGGTTLPEVLAVPGSPGVPAIPYSAAVPYLYQIVVDNLPIGKDPSDTQPTPGSFDIALHKSSTFNVEAGNYLVYVRDAYGCVAYATVTVLADPEPEIAAVIDPAFCSATEGNFAINVKLTTAGVGPYTYSLDGKAYVSTPMPFVISNLASGNHSVQVKDFNGCKTSKIDLTIFKPLGLDVKFTSQPKCKDADGTITATVSGGDTTTNNFEFSLVNNTTGATYPVQSTGIFTLKAAGKYTVTVKDLSTNCTKSADVDLLIPTDVVLALADIVVTLPNCTTPLVQPAPAQGNISNGTITVNLPAANNNPEYTYILTPLAPLTGLPLTQVSDNYFDGLLSGDYNVTVRSSRGCEKTVKVNIPLPIEVTASAAADAFLCSTGNSPKSTKVTVTGNGGAGTYTYSDNGTVYQDSNEFYVIDNKALQNITYYVKDKNGCVDAVTIPIVAFPLLTAPKVTYGPLMDCVNNKQEMNVVINGGTNTPNPFTYQVYENGVLIPGLNPVTGNTFIYYATTAGSYYEFEIFDNNTTCSIKSGVQTVPVFNKLNVVAGTSSQVGCKGDSTGKITINVTGYTGVYSYNVYDGVNALPVLSGTANTASGAIVTTGLPEGNYSVVVKETGYPECSATVNAIVITEPSKSLDLSNVITNVNQNCNTAGSKITVPTTSVTGGTPGYSYAIVHAGVVPNLLTGYTAWPATGDLTVILTGHPDWDIYVKDMNNCTDHETIHIVTDPVPSAIDAKPVSQCYDSLTETYIINVTASGVGPFEFSLDKQNFKTGPLTVRSPGTYTVYAKDANGCITEALAAFTILDPLGLSADISTYPTCNGNNGEITLYATGGTVSTPSSYQYSIGTGAFGTSNVFGALLPGITYTFHVKDMVTGCTKDVTKEIPKAILVTGIKLTATHVSCNGGSDGTIAVALDPSNTDVDYMFSTVVNGVTVGPQKTPLFKDLPAGNYTVRVISGRGCQETATIEVTQPDPIVIDDLVITEFACNAGTNTPNQASIEVKVSGGTKPYRKFEFIRVGTPNVIVQSTESPKFTEFNLAGGSYIINVFDSNSCMKGNITATIKPYISIDEIKIAVDKITCKTDENIKVTATSIRGTLPALVYTIKYPNGTIITDPTGTGTFNGLPVGEYTITVLNPATGCSLQRIHNVDEPNTFELKATNIKSITCFGSANGRIDFTLIDKELIPTNDAGRFDYVIAGPTPSSGSNPNAGPLSITGLKAGAYKITATLIDKPFCPVVADFIIQGPLTALELTVDHSEITCANGNKDGVITASAKGGWPGGYEFQLERDGSTLTSWSTTTTFPNLGFGNYIVRVRDTGKCEDSEPVPLSIPIPITATISTDKPMLTCFGDNTATITVSPVVGGSGKYSYTLFTTYADGTKTKNGPQLGNTFSGLKAGTYMVTVTDNWTCTADSNIIEIKEPTKVKALLEITSTESCQRVAQVTLTATGGSAPYRYSTDGVFYGSTFNTSVTIALPFTTAPVTYKYFVKDKFGCTSIVSNGIEFLPVPKLTLSSVVDYDIKCKGSSTGSIDAVATGGLGNYVYTLVNSAGQAITPAPTQNKPGHFENLAKGDYIVKVVSDDCNSQSLPVSITEPDTSITATAVPTDLTCNGSNNGKITVIASGGTGIIRYAISPDFRQFFESNVFDDLKPGFYDVMAQDENGCYFYIKDVEIKEPGILSPSLVPNSILPEYCAGDKNGAFSIEIVGGTAPYKVVLDDRKGTYEDVVGTTHPFINLVGGKHMVYVIDAKGCTAEVEIITPESVKLEPIAKVNTDCVNNAAANAVTITVHESNTNLDDIDYSLDGGTYQPSNIFVNVAPGKHTVTARHSNGCEKTTLPFMIEVVQPLTLTLADGGLNEIVATAKGGGGEYQYTLDGEPYGSVNKFIIYKSGTYTVVVTDKNGCTATASRYFKYIDVCVPNHFTPNGDGINDTWAPGCTINYKDLTYDIFDRYGRIICKYKLGDKWDGKYNGAELPSGDYWYVLKLNDPKDNREFVGHFTLYR